MAEIDDEGWEASNTNYTLVVGPSSAGVALSAVTRPGSTQAPQGGVPLAKVRMLSVLGAAGVAYGRFSAGTGTAASTDVAFGNACEIQKIPGWAGAGGAIPYFNAITDTGTATFYLNIGAGN